MPENSHIQRFEVLRQIALAGSSGSDLKKCAEEAIRGSVDLLNLNAGRILLWSETHESILSATHAKAKKYAALLDELEEDIFSVLRKRKNLREAYVTFGGENPVSAFTLPLRRGANVFGAALGVGGADIRIVREDLFLEALAAALSLAVFANPDIKIGSEQTLEMSEIIKKERLKAVAETAVTVNHEINNPLTAALGNVQLILMKRDDLDPDLRRKLEVVEKSALQIRDVTQRLLNLTEAKSVPYADKDTMIDLGGSREESSKSKKTPPKSETSSSDSPE
ncbi:MAG: hypothetical protein IIB00_06795 [candidate division Zixibacteria bacterium]|nr:hypothetical protein [candidate division Zixibacteria bacterium]